MPLCHIYMLNFSCISDQFKLFCISCNSALNSNMNDRVQIVIDPVFFLPPFAVFVLIHIVILHYIILISVADAVMEIFVPIHCTDDAYI